MATGTKILKEGKNIIWNRLYKTIPDDTALTQFVIGTGTATPTENDTYSTFSGIPSGFPKNFVSGFPTFDKTNKKVTSRGFVASTEANGITISEAGESNTDATKKAFTRDVFNGITKDNTQEIAFMWTHATT